MESCGFPFSLEKFDKDKFLEALKYQRDVKKESLFTNAFMVSAFINWKHLEKGKTKKVTIIKFVFYETKPFDQQSNRDIRRFRLFTFFRCVYEVIIENKEAFPNPAFRGVMNVIFQ